MLKIILNVSEAPGRLYRANGEPCMTDKLDKEPGVRNPTFDEKEEDVERRENRVQRDVSRTSVVKFDTGAGDDDEEAEDADAEGKETNFVRHNTPHPRELKTKAAKLLAKKGEQVKAVGAKDKTPEEREADTSTQVSTEEDVNGINQSNQVEKSEMEVDHGLELGLERESEVPVVQEHAPLVMNGDAHLWMAQPPKLEKQDSVDAEEDQPLMNDTALGDDADGDDGKVSRKITL